MTARVPGIMVRLQPESLQGRGMARHRRPATFLLTSCRPANTPATFSRRMECKAHAFRLLAAATRLRLDQSSCGSLRSRNRWTVSSSSAGAPVVGTETGDESNYKR